MNEAKSPRRAVICMLKTEVHDHVLFRLRMDELRRLVRVLRLEVTGEFVQTDVRPHARYLIGSGKTQELKSYVKSNKIEVVVFYNILKSNQKLNLMMSLDCEVIDRYEVILEIFDLMSSDTVSQLQIEAARLDKLYPFFKLRASLKYYTERPFFHSLGEYAYHGQVRALTGHISKIKKKIEVLKSEKRDQIRKRKELGSPTICIAGYYNAGKTSLFNALTGESKKVSDQPFTTLTSKYQRIYLNNDQTLLFIDTIGFVIDLDPRLIKSFELNLEDMRSADIVLLLLSVDDTFPLLSLKLRSGIKLLEDMGVNKNSIIVVFNKTDLLQQGETQEKVEKLCIEEKGLAWVTVSAKKKVNLERLLEAIQEKVREIRVEPLPAVVEGS